MARIYSNRLKSRSKYGNRRCSMDGFTFDSVKEMNRYADLKYLQLTGAIKDLELQKPFVLQDAFRDNRGKWQREIRYIADFYYYDNEKQAWIIEDVKSKATKDNAVYKIKKKMMLYRGLEISEV